MWVHQFELANAHISNAISKLFEFLLLIWFWCCEQFVFYKNSLKWVSCNWNNFLIWLKQKLNCASVAQQQKLHKLERVSWKFILNLLQNAYWFEASIDLKHQVYWLLPNANSLENKKSECLEKEKFLQFSHQVWLFEKIYIFITIWNFCFVTETKKCKLHFAKKGNFNCARTWNTIAMQVPKFKWSLWCTLHHLHSLCHFAEFANEFAMYFLLHKL